MYSFVGHPHFCFDPCNDYSLIMEDAYYRKVYMVNKEFQPWTPLALNRPESDTKQNFQSSAGNFPKPTSPQNWQPLKKDLHPSQQDHMKASNCFNGCRGRGSVPVKSSYCSGNPNGGAAFPWNACKQSSCVPQLQQIIHEASFPGFSVECQKRSYPGTAPANGHSASSSSSRVLHNSQKVFKPCSFCRQNGDPREFFETHQLKDSFGNVVCPILRAYICEICGATGSQAHTRTYCPLLKATGQKPRKNAVCLKNTPRNSSGGFRHLHLNM